MRNNSQIKTTLELPDELMRRASIRAAVTDRKLRETVEELIRRGLDDADNTQEEDRLAALKQPLRFHTDGSITNPDGIGDPGFFEALDENRAAGRAESPRSPFSSRRHPPGRHRTDSRPSHGRAQPSILRTRPRPDYRELVRVGSHVSGKPRTTTSHG